jgi:predicted nucleic acid-binding protein
MPHFDRLPNWLPKLRSGCGSRVLTGSSAGRPLNSSALTANRIDPVTVVDASVFVDALVSSGLHGELARDELRGQTVLEVPAIFGAEVTSALRMLVLRGELSPLRAATAREQVRTVRTIQYPFEPFSHRVWQLRANLTVYDAWYVALAEWLGTDLVTADQRLANASGLRCAVRRL